MKRLLFAAAALAGMALIFAQEHGPARPQYPAFETLSILPRESPPGFYTQVDRAELQRAAAEGWELVSVMPYVYRNEERGTNNPKAVVTQTYPAYFFKRLKAR